MYKTILILLIIFGICFSQDKKPRTAILDFDEDGSVDSTDAIALTSMFQSAISGYDFFELLSRKDVYKIVKDQDVFNKSADSLKILAKDLKVKYLIIGSIGQLGNLYIATTKVVDDESKIVASVSKSYQGDKEGLADLMNDIAETLMDDIDPGYFWYYAGATIAIAGGVYAYLFLQEENKPVPKLPKPPTP